MEKHKDNLSFKEQAIVLIGEGELEQAIKEIMSHRKFLTKEQANELIGLKSQLNIIEKKNRKGTISAADYDVKINILNQGLLNFINEVEITTQKSNQILENTPVFRFTVKDKFQPIFEPNEINVLFQQSIQRQKDELSPTFLIDIAEEQFFINEFEKISNKTASFSEQKQLLELKDILNGIEKLKKEIRYKISTLLILKEQVFESQLSYEQLELIYNILVNDIITIDDLIYETEITEYFPLSERDYNFSKGPRPKNEIKLDLLPPDGGQHFSIDLDRTITKNLFQNVLSTFSFSQLEVQSSAFYNVRVLDLENVHLVEKVIPAFIRKAYDYQEEFDLTNDKTIDLYGYIVTIG